MKLKKAMIMLCCVMLCSCKTGAKNPSTASHYRTEIMETSEEYAAGLGHAFNTAEAFSTEPDPDITSAPSNSRYALIQR